MGAGAVHDRRLRVALLTRGPSKGIIVQFTRCSAFLFQYGPCKVSFDVGDKNRGLRGVSAGDSDVAWECAGKSKYSYGQTGTNIETTRESSFM